MAASGAAAGGEFNGVFRLENRAGQYGARIWALTFDLPGEKVNKLNAASMQAFEGVLDRLEKMTAEIDAVVLISGKPGNFIAGADIEMIQAVKSAAEAQQLSRMGQKLMSRWEDLKFPTVAAVSGAALGGGCEFALACSAIVMTNDPSAKIGMPETMLGLIPGMGGCVRTPRKIGIAGALDLILAGKALNGERAYRAGLIEAAIPKESFEESAFRWTRKNLEKLKSGQRLAKEPKLGGMGGTMGSLLEHTPFGRAMIYKKARQGVLSKTRGAYPAPLEAIAVMRANGAAYGPKLRGPARERAMEREAEAFGRMAATEVSRNLIRIFFLTEGVKKSKGLEAGSSARPRKVGSAAVLGAGVMGGGIAQLLADRGIPARMKDLNEKALTLGIQSANQIFRRDVKKRKINSRQWLQKLNLISPVTDYAGFHSVDCVVEAIIEKMDVKKKVFQELEQHVADECVIASNTSSLSITEMQSVMKRPERFAGMHFFNPVSRMPLVEVIRGAQSNDEAVSTIYEFSKRLGKTPIVVKDAPGFLVNRLLTPYLNEATWMLADGVPIQEMDEVMLSFGMPMGPMELIDEVGVDVGEKVVHVLHEAFGDRMAPAPYNPKIVAAGRLGKKNGKGFYSYENPAKKKQFDPAIYAILGVTPQPRAVSAEEVVDRCVLPMINEAARCLEEKIVNTPAEVDLGMIMGTGFPPFRGGLLRYADTLGPQTIVEKLQGYQKRFGARFEPSPAMVSRASHGQKFYRD
jgi:3-hydroxyacyl-CoA dehydrogenase/enoyl-CoA hydratase/3-hydroxybutyryl-CoA epimerase